MSKNSSKLCFPLKENNFEGELEESIFSLIRSTISSKTIPQNDISAYDVRPITIEQQDIEPVINKSVSIHEDESVRKSYLKIAAIVMLVHF